MKRKKASKKLRIILGLELIAVTVIFLMIIIKGDISFHTIGAKETMKEDNKEEQKSATESDSKADPNPLKKQDPAVVLDPSAEQKAEIGGAGSEEELTKEETDTIIISAAGDVTLGRDHNYGYENSFDHELKVQGMDYSYFFRNVKDIFAQDDITIVNLETTLTTAKQPAEKKFRFKADPSYVEILKQGDIEVVNVANNHTRDYLEKGYTDTLATLKEAGVGYFGYEHTYIQEIRGIKVGLAGFVGWEATKDKKQEIQGRIEELKEQGADLVIVMFHWGIERDYDPNSVQKELARYSIDHGADLVLGGHPHVLQGIEEYKGKNIVYSLGNFSFGGNKNPSDKDTMVYVHKFHFTNGALVSEENEIIPCSISSVKNRNNYQPTPLEGKEKDRVLDKIEKFSKF